MSNPIQINGFEHYSIKECGEIINTKTGKILKWYLNRKGYPRVKLCNRKNQVQPFIHRLVAEIYLPNPDNLPQVHHLDTDKLNPHRNNLKWVTGGENIWYRDINNQWCELLEEAPF